MSIQVKNYIDEMEKTYSKILNKLFDGCELSEVDRLFIEVYERTIRSRV